MQLPQVDLGDPQSVERALQFFARLRGAPLTGLGGQEELARVALQPRRHAELRVAVARGHVNVVDVVLQEHVEGAIGHVLRDAPQRGAAEEDARALVAGSAKGKKGDRHAITGCQSPPRLVTVKVRGVD